MLTVQSLMTANPETVSPGDSLHTVLAKMNNGGCHHLPVVDGGALVGIVTDRDMRLAVNSPVLFDEARLLRTAVLDELDVSECMTPDPMTVGPDYPAHEAADLLALHGFGAVPVVRDGALVGILTVTDFLKHVASQGARS
jgi:acetoin utilization protein AcuB